ncbi:protease inhibitor [Aspergillus eucalypticola CBS 122712]|uniref:Protease inhibitor n=1 Tax=Aspergillus eucalypticola (strain CBS 122712 / IBT 29274) TaxID=1448314 RepID=A0A317UYA2_ASPEC|nr:protease inhibitor [Aspergillus eucalypticola CBS 122712]PWY67033.1 protease inhibitor [Aspergillus eucalypticola CBS 122712]
MALTIPVEICDMIVDHVVATVEKDYSLRDLFPYTLDLDARSQLMSLRLVSRNFCAAASLHLFKRVIAPINSSVRGRSSLQRFIEISRSKYAAHVRNLETGYNSWFASLCPIIGQEIQDFAGLLSPCLAQLSDLRVLKFRASVESSIRVMTRDQERTAIEAIVTALRFVILPHLEGLELFFPMAHDFRYFFPSPISPLYIPMEDLLHGLKYLALHVTAYTKELGQRYWRTPVPPAYAAFPNNLHAAHLFRLVELAPNLEALRISSTDVIPFHTIHSSPALRLTSLCLERVLITFDHIRALTGQCKDHLKHIEPSLVELHSGTWHMVLTQLRQLPHLIDISINSCGYPFTGPNAHLRGILPEPDDPEPLETMNTADYRGLDELKDFVNANRVALGLEPWERRDSRWSR